MQYLLTEDELDNLSPKKERDLYYKNSLTLAVLVAEIYNQPCPAYYAVRKQRQQNKGYGYCDSCHAKEECPFENKQWSQ